MKKANTNEVIRQFYLFLTGCLVGWIYEVSLGFLYGLGFVNRGFLFGPYLPIYGFGLILLNLLLHRLMERPVKVGRVKINPLLVFLGVIIITTILEYIVGYALLKLFELRLWDYSAYWMNLQGIISFKTSLRFGIGGMFLLYVLVPLGDKTVSKLGIKAGKTIMYVVLSVMTLDFIFTLLCK